MKMLPSVTVVTRRFREPLIDEPQDDELWIDLALVNWGAWCRFRARPGRCASAEGAYLPPALRLWNPPEPVVMAMGVTAEEVNGALVAVPAQHREALRLRYYERLPDRVIARRLALVQSAYQRFMRDARLMVADVLHRRRIVHIIPADNSSPRRSDETETLAGVSLFAKAKRLLGIGKDSEKEPTQHAAETTEAVPDAGVQSADPRGPVRTASSRTGPRAGRAARNPA